MSAPFVGTTSHMIFSDTCKEYTFTATDPTKVCSIKMAAAMNGPYVWDTKPVTCASLGYSNGGSWL